LGFYSLLLNKTDFFLPSNKAILNEQEN